MRIIELFGGIGAFTSALKKANVPFEIVDYVEKDENCVRSYNAMNDTDFSPCDVTEWHKYFDDIDVIIHGSPCQDFSCAGKQAGGDKGSGTRSSLMFETIRIVRDIMPKVVIWENVKNLLSKRHIHNFNEYIDALDELGYKSYYQVLNSKDYGVPQNRERVFTVSIRKDIDCGTFRFPQKQTLTVFIKDLLEKSVPEKYYLKDEQVKTLLRSTYEMYKQKKGDGEPPWFTVKLTEPIIVASRGRNPANSSDGTVGTITQQRLEPNLKGLSNTITSVQKDNYVFEPR